MFNNNNNMNSIAPANSSSSISCSQNNMNNNSTNNNCSTLIAATAAKKYSHSANKLATSNSSIAQNVYSSSKNVSKSSLRLDIVSKTSDALELVPDSNVTADVGDTVNNKGGDSVSSPRNAKKSVKRNFSIISFKSLDFNLKSFCSSMKGKHSKDTHSNGSGKSTAVGTTSSSKTSITTTTKAPYLRVEVVDQDADEEHLLISFPQSPYSHRGSFDKTQSQHLTTVQSDFSRSQASSPFLSITTPPNIRRSSTSDIIDKKPSLPSVTATPNDTRRPSTSDLLRRARERKGSETKGRTFHIRITMALISYANLNHTFNLCTLLQLPVF